eukprot:CAMPEP_0176371400 /NCGR_PEP_ID=MMETSP0126-20121128/24670_1 /TAXON_ID=141414 ORGANISM="Strombidinopsis acuminatum, Strain SPMC142" /NCGR_SAMPLE_ID=MMETSP0126 /ASSEMBLY_ACC=CAM_ASM_000229 /LENGTH=60 /DNA_ID=CAMNT_0017730839 /DNA_START=157 /DNA_END=339 /DNA_ORIENTATION=+
MEGMEQKGPSDAIALFDGHEDSALCIACLPKEPYDIFITGDCNDKALLWKLTEEKNQQVM